MVKNIFKLFLVSFFIFGIIGISIVKNISVQKKNYISQLQLELHKQQEAYDIYKIEWDHLTSPINLGSKINKCSPILVAIAQSHRKIWKEIVNDNSQYSIIFEDDIIIKY